MRQRRFSYFNLRKKKQKQNLRTYKPLTTTRGQAKCCKNDCFSFLVANFKPSRKPQVVLGAFFLALASPVSPNEPGQTAVSSIQRKTKHILPLLILCAVWFTLNSLLVVMVILRVHPVDDVQEPFTSQEHDDDVGECKRSNR